MPRYEIEYNGVTSIRREFPDSIGDVKAANLKIYDRAGAALATISQVVAPTAPTAAVAITSSTNTVGSHLIKLAYVTANGTTQLGTASSAVVVTAAQEDIALTAVPVSADTMVTARNVYMTKSSGSTYYYVGQIGNNTATTYTIAIADTNLTVVGPTVNTSATTIPQIGAPTSYTYKAVLTSAMAAGDFTATLDATPDTIYTGDVYRIGSATSAQDTLTVESYNSSTRVVSFTSYCRHSHAAGEYLKARFCTYSLDTTSTTAWTGNKDLTFEWTFFSDGAGTASPYMPYTDEGRILKRISGEGGLEASFRLRYRQFSEMVQDVDFNSLQSDAMAEIGDILAARGLDVQKVVDSHALYELHLVQMAYSLAYGLGSDWAEERTAIKERRLDLINLICSLPIWQDVNQDLVESDVEVQTHERPYPRRRIY